MRHYYEKLIINCFHHKDAGHAEKKIVPWGDLLALKISNIQSYAEGSVELLDLLRGKRSDKVRQNRLGQTYEFITMNTALVL